MIHAVLILNTIGNPRLAKFYTPLDIPSQQTLIRQVNELLSTRSPAHSNFLEVPQILQGQAEDELRVVFRLYASLYFVFIADEQESELGLWDLIQTFVEALDKCFTNVCELDIVFGWEVLQTVLEELIQGGMVLETNVQKIVEAIDRNNKEQSSLSGSSSMTGMSGKIGGLWNEDALKSASQAFADATSTFRSFLPGR